MNTKNRYKLYGDITYWLFLVIYSVVFTFIFDEKTFGLSAGEYYVIYFIVFIITIVLFGRWLIVKGGNKVIGKTIDKLLEWGKR